MLPFNKDQASVLKLRSDSRESLRVIRFYELVMERHLSHLFRSTGSAGGV